MTVTWVDHGALGKTAHVYAPTEAEAEFEVAWVLMQHPAADFGPVVERVTGEFGAFGHGLVDGTRKLPNPWSIAAHREANRSHAR